LRRALAQENGIPLADFLVSCTYEVPPELYV
jgi:hypothetical protein